MNFRLSKFQGALCLLVVFDVLSPVLCTYRCDARIKKAMEMVQGSSHLPAIARRRLLPFPHSEAFESLENNKHSPCLDASQERYRRPNGLCNNLRNPFQGAVLDTESRMFSNFYLDGRSFPRIRTKDLDNLPSAREVSVKCLGVEEDTNGDGTSKLATQLLVLFGQFLSHDISHVQTFNGVNSCCDNFSRDDPFAQLYNKSGTCYPIEIPPNDPFFNDTCMIFSRAYAVDVFGVREPINGVTSYIDASTIYGSSVNFENGFRRGVAGLLKTSMVDGVEQIPNFGHFLCDRRDGSGPCGCPISGDERVNDQPGLTAVHTLFHLEHNRISRELFKINRQWTDERLFQETKRITTAILQKVVYEDFLPLLVGNDVMEHFNLKSPFIYDEGVDARAILEFTVAASRFGHTLVNTRVNGLNFSDAFYLPTNMEGYQNQKILFSSANTSALEFNNKFTAQLQNRLFQGLKFEGISPAPGPSLDLMALNINRGRDTGIATYTVVRDACAKLLRGVEGVREDHLPACWDDEVYRNEEDIDLFVGGVSEPSLPGAILGPTFACLSAIQFQRLKFGDRFFYEGPQTTGFSEDQLQFIKRSTLASMVCEMKPDNWLQKDVFRPVSDSNPRVPCSTILDERNLDEGIKSWRDASTHKAPVRQRFLNKAVCNRNDNDKK